MVWQLKSRCDDDAFYVYALYTIDVRSHMSKESKSHCFTDLIRRILSLELAPGADLDEASLAQHYGISRTPLREVLQKLAGLGYVQTSSNRGAVVSSMNVSVMRVFFRTAPTVYAHISRLAAEQGSGTEVSALKDTQSAFVAALRNGDPSEAALCNHRFHAQIGTMARNPYLMAALDRLLIDHTRLGQTFYRASNQTDTALITKAADQHDAMIDAFERHDAELAVDFTLQHWDLSRDRMERFVRPDPLPFDFNLEKDRADAV